jgi:hypothetical protein
MDNETQCYGLHIHQTLKAETSILLCMFYTRALSKRTFIKKQKNAHLQIYSVIHYPSPTCCGLVCGQLQGVIQ